MFAASSNKKNIRETLGLHIVLNKLMPVRFWDMRTLTWCVAIILIGAAFSYFGSNSLSSKTEVARSECYDAINQNQRFAVWYDLNTVYSFFKPYVFYQNNGHVYQFRTDSRRSLVCYKYRMKRSKAGKLV